MVTCCRNGPASAKTALGGAGDCPLRKLFPAFAPVPPGVTASSTARDTGIAEPTSRAVFFILPTASDGIVLLVGRAFIP